MPPQKDPATGKFPCRVEGCGAEFDSEGALRSHRRHCDGGTWRCGWCGASAPLCAGGELSFTVFDSFKASSIYPGHFKLVEVHTGHVAASGTFHFAAHWRRTVVTADVDLMSRHADSATDVELIGWNTRNKTTSQNMTCTA